MKFVFVTGCLEPGKDGVGDYTRLLALECARQGHQCLLISLNDHFVSAPVFISETTAERIAEFRIPASSPWKKRFAECRQKIEKLGPDWISFQFVSYGLQRKGIIFGLINGLCAIAKGVKVQVMFHELWIGEDVAATVKSRAIGRIQKYFILKMIRTLKPEIVHTSNSAYCSLLQSSGVACARLPLFGSIPVTRNPRTDWIIERLRIEGINTAHSARDSFWFFGLFGSLHPIWPPEPLLPLLLEAGNAHRKRIVLLAVGRLGPGSALWQEMSRKYRDSLSCVWLGELPTDKVSEYLQFIDFGIATSPYDLCGKSGTVSAMLEHGLPVVVNRTAPHFRTFQPSESEGDPQLCKLDVELPRKLKTLTKRRPNTRLAEIARRFLDSLGVKPSILSEAQIQTEIKNPSWAGKPVKPTACGS